MPEDLLTTPRPSSRRSPTPGPRPGAGWGLVVIGLLLTSAAAGAWWYSHRGEAGSHRSGVSPAAGSRVPATATALRVEVIAPKHGGLGRKVVQPGVVRSFDRADLYAKVSGYLIRQKVDIGDRVEKGQVLAEVDVPELFKARDQARAAVGQIRAKIKQMEARVLTAQADRETAGAVVQRSEAAIAKFTADRVYRKEQLDRITELARRQAIAERLVDEQRNQYDAARSAEAEGQAAVTTAKAEVAAATARVAQAQADTEAARADLAAAEADLARAQVLVDYTRITSPYAGVITLRSFHDGDFIRSASEGGSTPLLSVSRTDLMRVVILVPDLDVPFVDRGDPATLRVDALKEQVFRGAVARFSNAENEQKLMRTELDIPNPDNRLRDGMYGTATIAVEPPSPNLRIPSTCLIEQTDQGEGAVYLVRDGKTHRQPVRVARDDGREVEITQGLSPEDSVIVRYNGSIAEGLAVRAEPAEAATTGRSGP